jgi:hypothetical protein
MTITLLIGAHALALAGVLALARRDHMLVDEAGRPTTHPWEERRVPASEAVAHR